MVDCGSVRSWRWCDVLVIYAMRTSSISGLVASPGIVATAPIVCTVSILVAMLPYTNVLCIVALARWVVSDRQIRYGVWCVEKCKSNGKASLFPTILVCYFVAPAVRTIEVAVSPSTTHGEEPSQPHTEGDSVDLAEPALDPNILSGRDMSEQR